MKKLTCIAIDDEPIALLIISQFCERKGGLELTTFSEPLTGLKEIARCKPTLWSSRESIWSFWILK